MNQLQTPHHVPFAAYFWMAVVWLITLLLLAAIVKFLLVSFFRKRNNQKGNDVSYMFLVGFCTLLLGCEPVENMFSKKQEVYKLYAEYNLKVNNFANKDSAIIFESVNDARRFIDLLIKKKYNDDFIKQTFIKTGKLVINNNSSARLKFDPCNSNFANFRRDYSPWNSVNYHVNFDPFSQKVTSATSWMSGFTFPFSVQQLYWNQTPNEDDPITPDPARTIITFQVAVSVNVNIITQEIGTIYQDTVIIKGYLIPCPGGGSRVEYEEVN